MVLKLGINDWPMPGRMVRRATYIKEYQELTHKDGIPFVPDAAWKDMHLSPARSSLRAVCAAFFGPFGPSGQPDPTIMQTVPKPDFFFQWLYALLAFLPPQMETPALSHWSSRDSRHGLSCCRSLPAKARKAGSGGRLRWLSSFWRRLRSVPSRIWPAIRRGARSWMRGAAILCR